MRLGHHIDRAPTAGRREGGFVLPLVVMLTVVAGIMITVMLERQSNQHLAVDKQIKSYQSHHGGRGIQEIAWTWIQSRRGALTDALDRDHRAFDLELADGSVVSIFLYDGQGPALGDSAALTGDDQIACESILDLLQNPAPARGGRGSGHGSGQGRPSSGGSGAPPGAPDDALTRTVGPLAVSAQTAPPEVLNAVLTYVIGGSGVGSYVKEIVRLRAEGKLNQAALTTVLAKADLKPEQHTQVDRLLVIEPSLWRMVAELHDGRSREVFSRYGGYILLDSTGGNQGLPGRGAWQQMGPFLSWEDLGVP
jgi:hypothetical protein